MFDQRTSNQTWTTYMKNYDAVKRFHNTVGSNHPITPENNTLCKSGFADMFFKASVKCMYILVQTRFYSVISKNTISS